LDSAAQARIALRLQAEIAQLVHEGRITPSPAARHRHPKFLAPVRATRQSDFFHPTAVSSFVDHNVFSGRQDYACGSRTYNGHTGTDFFPWPFAWMAMDSNWVEVIAAAPGIIIFKEDGQDDRICDGSGPAWNAVYVQHADGSVAWYGHLKSGSLTAKSIGDPIDAGEYLGFIGSSGNSTGPHLHFEVHDVDGNLIDPFGGSCNDLNPESWWIDQEPYQVSTITKILFHDNLPAFGACGTSSAEQPNIRQQFYASDDIFLGLYLRDPKVGQKLAIRILRPDGMLFKRYETTVTNSGAAGYEIAHLKINRNPQFGEWTVLVDYERQQFSSNFRLCLNEEICTCNAPNDLHNVPLPASFGLYWNGPENAEEYQVRVETVTRVVRNFYIEANNIDLTGLGPENTLRWQVRARCGDVMSAWSQGLVPRPSRPLPDLPDSLVIVPPLREASGWHWPTGTGTRLTLYDLNGQQLAQTQDERLTVPFGLTSGLYLLEQRTPDGLRRFARVSW
jgi:murein DD-endopeptidase MepM/ murein hydrolase activator NlpD